MQLSSPENTCVTFPVTGSITATAPAVKSDPTSGMLIKNSLVRGLYRTLAMPPFGWVLCQPALSQTDVADGSHPFRADSDRNHDRHSHIVPIAAIRVPGTSNANPFVNFDQASVETKLQLLFVSSRSSKAVAIFDALTDRKLGETPAIFAGVGIDSPHSGPDGNVIAGHYLFAGDYPSIPLCPQKI